MERFSLARPHSGRNRGCLLVLFAIATIGVVNAQTLAVSRNTLTNHGVVTLAKAGFDEEFLIDTILSSRTQFDTSVEGLADLAKQGITERIIRVMMNPGPSVGAPAAAASQPAVLPSIAAAPPVPARRQESAGLSELPPAGMAIVRQTPYSQSTSLFWGLWKRKIGVAETPLPQKPVETIGTHLGTVYERVQRQRPYIPVGGVPVYTSLPVLAQYGVER